MKKKSLDIIAEKEDNIFDVSSEYKSILKTLLEVVSVKGAFLSFINGEDYFVGSEEIDNENIKSQNQIVYSLSSFSNEEIGSLVVFGHDETSLTEKEKRLISNFLKQLVTTYSLDQEFLKSRNSSLQAFETYSARIDQFSIVSRTDLSGSIIDVNENFIKVTGYSRKKLLENKYTILNSGQHPKSFFENMWNELSNGRTWRNEIRIRTKSGGLSWLDTTIIPVFDKSNQIIEYVAFHQDITQRKQSDKIHIEIQRINNIGGWKLDLETWTPIWSDEVFKIHELEVGNVGDVENALDYYGEDKEKFQKMFMEAIEAGISYEGDFRFITAKGNHRWVRVYGKPEFDRSGKAIHYYGTIQDITKKKEVEIAMEESEYNMSQLFHQSRDATMTLEGPDWSFTSCNVATLNLLNVDSEESFKLLSPWEISPEYQKDGSSSIESVKRIISNTLIEGTSYFEWTCQKMTGELVDCKILVSRIEQNKKVILHASIRDITKEKKLEEEINASQNLLESALDGASIGVWDWSFEKNQVKYDKRWANMVGYPDDELEMNFETWRELVHPDDIDMCTKSISDYINGKSSSYEVLHRLKHRNGKWIHVLGRGQITGRDHLGKVNRITGTNLDVSKTKQMQVDRLEELNEILSSTPSCLKVLNNKGQLIDINAQGLRMIEAESLESVLMATSYELVEESHRERFIKYNEEVCSGEKGSIVFEMKSLKGTRRWIESYSAPFRLVNGEIGHISISNDITDKIESSNELARQKEMAQHQMKLASIGELAAGVGHEINNPLAIVQGYISVIEKKISRGGDLDICEIEAPMEKINVAINRISKIVKGLRTFSRSDTLDEHLFDAVHSVKESSQLVEEIYLKDGVQVIFSTKVKEGEIEVFGNQGQFQQVIMNLISNARDALRDSKGCADSKVIKISVEEVFHILVVSVNDNGAGIPEHLMDKIFDPFFTTKDVNAGTGIGLSLAHRFISDMHGSLEVKSDKTEGTTFKIAIPCTQRRVSDQED